MRALLAKIDVDYWLNIGIAVFLVWRAASSGDRDAMFLLFAATYCLIHAQGRRILEETKKQEAGK